MAVREVNGRSERATKEFFSQPEGRLADTAIELLEGSVPFVVGFEGGISLPIH